MSHFGIFAKITPMQFFQLGFQITLDEFNDEQFIMINLGFIGIIVGRINPDEWYRA